MSVSPGQYNITLQRRADFYLQLQFRDSGGAAIDLTDWAVYAQAWDKARANKYVDFTVEYVNRSLGIVKLWLTEVQTAALPCESFYDVMLVDDSDVREYYLEGMIFVSEGYTTPPA